ncbi:ArsR/SmtB family transcription factor [Clostridium estertheticum]|uniref:ArsR/SmtB family transcription factor n=1 Tax=Clostridium estertheticum TaxID=238834 RepID=UPI001CF2644A|nr:metalloregulator ArsR/SmtB family transcription factor [Clostridium estertheticum]MCB2354237.1 metalloregulator ArsR/SmtB family transcription factor [Clostridium estertheticum]MCB2359771.1 metalloregulator ArsR/SmtB family transcription factor [Clostridium estertheticum]WAG42640.1 metalloregulator ArsR/SmtB family transcription factor [Clostridium estertheticum]
MRKLKKEASVCDETGIKEFVKTIHTRIEVTDKAFLLHKYKLFTVPFDLFMPMKALGDETRLKILSCIYKKTNSTQAIAKEVGITEAGVSKHFKIMYKAGVIHKRRDGNFINYIIEKKVIDRIPMDVYQYLNK